MSRMPNRRPRREHPSFCYVCRFRAAFWYPQYSCLVCEACGVMHRPLEYPLEDAPESTGNGPLERLNPVVALQNELALEIA